MKIVIKSIIYFIITIYPLTAQDGWEWQNPEPIGHDLLYVKSFDNGLVIVVSNCGTLMKSYDYGENWDLVQNDSYSFSKVQFFDEYKGYALVDEPRKNDDEALFRTEDGGENWIQIEEDFNNQCSFYFINPDTGWIVGVDGYIKKTTDGCKTWVELPSIDESYNNLFTVYFLDADTGFVAGNQIFMTENGGSSWEKVEGVVDGWVNTIYFLTDQIGWIGGGESILKTVDGGKSWNFQATGGLDIYSFEFLNTNEGYAVGNGVYRTIDGGKNWKKQVDHRMNSISFANNQVGWAVGRYGMIYKTFLFLGNKIWVKITKGSIENLNDIFFVDENKGWAVGTNGTILYTINGGVDWYQQQSNTTHELLSVCFYNDSCGWIVGVETILHTKDSGRNWIVYEHQFENYIFCVYFFDEKNGWICGNLDCILKTTDGGETWEEIPSTVGGLESVFFINDSVGWFSNTIGIYKTEDGGYTLKKVIEESDHSGAHSISFLTPEIGWRCTGLQSMTMGAELYGEVFKTTDGGVTWESQLGGAYFSKIHFFDEFNGIAIGNIGGKGYVEGTVFRTEDGGVNWESKILSRGIWRGINSFSFSSTNNGWIVGNNGIILRATDSWSLSTIHPERYIKLINFILRQNYPNPFNPSTTIEFSLPKSEFVELKIYNILGEEVSTLVSKKLNQGNYTYTFDGQNLASGIYYYQLVAGDYREVKKMLLVK